VVLFMFVGCVCLDVVVWWCWCLVLVWDDCVW
jgi:hypothetical protein